MLDTRVQSQTNRWRRTVWERHANWPVRRGPGAPVGEGLVDAAATAAASPGRSQHAFVGRRRSTWYKARFHMSNAASACKPQHTVVGSFTSRERKTRVKRARQQRTVLTERVAQDPNPRAGR